MNFHIWDDCYRVVVKPKNNAPIFVRYGLWANMRRSRNHATGVKENGISVYPAVYSDGIVGLAPEIETCPSLDGQGRLCFAVTGRQVGCGSDGEPVIVGVKMLPYALSLTCKRY